ncbi:hypothetical protein [Oryzibacter oryziterrae]|uniref:hypothetical protein n=1 Tax=Oryzibacter oryziterrae TaxID=2766474 RepID=UPI001F3E3599|nr:hypothetical protein [Oryzibacter oryziterrae]
MTTPLPTWTVSGLGEKPAFSPYVAPAEETSIAAGELYEAANNLHGLPIWIEIFFNAYGDARNNLLRPRGKIIYKIYKLSPLSGGMAAIKRPFARE